MNPRSQLHWTLEPELALRLDAVCNRFEKQWRAGTRPRLEEFLPQVDEADRRALLRELLDLELEYRGGEQPKPEEYEQRLPEFADIIAAAFFTEHLIPVNTSDPQRKSDEKETQIGRYRIDKILGEGGFGQVYLAYDDQLNRFVAIKVPRRERISTPEDADGAQRAHKGVRTRLTLLCQSDPDTFSCPFLVLNFSIEKFA